MKYFDGIDALMIAGVVFVLMGVVMCIFRRYLAKVFCRCGKQIFNNSSMAIKEMAEVCYDEKSMPRNMVFLGWVMIIQGVIFALLSYFHVMG